MERWYTYIIYSRRIDKYYIGSTSDIRLRIERHNLGWGKYTSTGIPWELKYYEEHETKTLALKREKEIKRMKSRKYIEDLINSAGGRPE